MPLDIFHIYRNTPLGRETLLQATDFTKKIGGRLQVYLPEFDSFLFYFEQGQVEIRLDPSYLFLKEAAESKMAETLQATGVMPLKVKPASMPASNLPRLSTDFDVLSLPRVMVERQGRASIGAGVRQLVKKAHAPALISPGRFHDWQEILVLFGGSRHSVHAVKWGLLLAERADLPFRLLTLCAPGESREPYEKVLLEHEIAVRQISDWQTVPGEAAEILNEIPRDALIVMGAYGHGRIKAKLFGSLTELIQKNTAHPIVLIGDACHDPESTTA